MPTVTLSPVLKQQFWGNDGKPLVGGQVFTYLAGTPIKTPTYSDPGGVSLNTNPILLDFRGEANIYVEPNKRYKFVLAPKNDTDPPTNPIWTINDATALELLTLYGGLDTGVADAYVLNFTANFTAYTDGVVIYWIAGNSNTGASTINVNGLGPVNIVNQGGGPLTPGQILAGQVITIMYLGGSFLLLSSGIAASVSAGTFAPVWAGFSAAPTGDMSWQITGRQVTLEWLGTLGTSNANFMSIQNLPTNLRPTSVGAFLGSTFATVVVDNGALAIGSMGMSGLGVISFSLGVAPPSPTGFTNSGSKGLDRQWTCTYLMN